MKTRLKLLFASVALNGGLKAHSPCRFNGKFWRERQLKLAATPLGRMLLHLICFSRDGRIRWHARGLGRELALLLSLSEWLAWLARAEVSDAKPTLGTAFKLEHSVAETSL